MKRYLKEPLLHFLIFGGLLFGAYAWLNPGARNLNTEPRQVRIGAGEVVTLLRKSLAEEVAAEQTLRKIASGLIKNAAA